MNADQPGATKDRKSLKSTSLKYRKIALCRFLMRHRRGRAETGPDIGRFCRVTSPANEAAIKEKWSARECELIFGVSGGNLSTSHVVVVVRVERAPSLPATYPDYGSRAGTSSAVHEGGRCINNSSNKGRDPRAMGEGGKARRPLSLLLQLKMKGNRAQRRQTEFQRQRG